jgi:hypothetical protein
LAEAERKVEQHLAEVMSEHIHWEMASHAPTVTDIRGKKKNQTRITNGSGNPASAYVVLTIFRKPATCSAKDDVCTRSIGPGIDTGTRYVHASA